MGPESWVVSSVVSSPFHHAQLNNMNNSTAGLRIMLPFIVMGVKRHNCLGVSSRFSQELKKDALYFGSSKWANTLLFSSWNTLPFTKIAFSTEGKLLEKDYSLWSCFCSSFPIGTVFLTCSGLQFPAKSNESYFAWFVRSCTTVACTAVASTLCPSQASVLIICTHSSPRVLSFLSSCGSPAQNDLCPFPFVSRSPT